ELCEAARRDYGGRDDVAIHCNAENRGLSYGRNKGAQLATGEVIAFLDDDALADEGWVEELVGAYDRHDALAVGGRMVPEWVAGRPEYVPEEFYFLFGVTHAGFSTEETEVRNTFSSNLSFRREVFLDLGGFKEHLGKRGTNDLQGGETELCSRLRENYDTGVVYNPNAVVAHKVFDYRTRFRWLIGRAFWQGYSKRMMEVETPGAIEQEWGFLGQLLRRFIPRRIKALIRRPSVDEATQLVALLTFLGAVGAGYGWAAVSGWR
ncbi:MAG: glycosyltransferase, partial [Halobacteriales archaeon]|nr:glycosyltransferase [Halobacteriales archaeon]